MRNNIASDANNSVDFKNRQQDEIIAFAKCKFGSQDQLPGMSEELQGNQKNILIDSGQNIPSALSGQCGTECSIKNGRQRRYTKAQEIETLAVGKYKNNGKGVTYRDLLSRGLAAYKEQAQITLKHCFKKKTLFTVGNYKPQQYYPTSLKSEILRKNIPVGVTGVGHSNTGLPQGKPTTSSSQDLDPVIIQTLEGYVLPLLPKAPLCIHKMHLRVRIPPECYHEISLPLYMGNKGKEYEEIIGRAHVRYCFYANGTVMVFTESSANPFKLEDEFDLSRLIAFFGQMRDRLVLFLADRHERIIPDIMQWQLTQWEINKDVKVDDGWAQITGLNIQVKHIDHLFRVYIKSLGKDTVCRVEESCNSINKPVIESINDILNPCHKFEQRFVDLNMKLTEIHNMLKELASRTNSGDRRGI